VGLQGQNAGRGQTIKKYIRDMDANGPSKAVVTLTLTNRGPEAYKPDDMGDEIELKREIWRSGRSKYILKGSGGATGDKHKDFEALRDALKLNLDNPIVFLHQARSKTLLKDTSGIELYDMFVRTTGLSVCFEELKKEKKEHEQTQHKLSSSIEERTEAQRELKHKNKIATNMRQLKDKISDQLRLEAMVPYAKLYHEQKALESEEAAFQKMVADEESRQEEADDVNTRLKECEEALQKATDELRGLSEQKNTYRKEMQALREKVESAKHAKEEKQAEVQQLRTQLANRRHDKQQLDTQRAGLLRDRTEEVDQQIKAIKEKLAQLTKQQETASKQLADTHAAAEARQKEAESLSREMRVARERESEAQAAAADAKRKLAALQGQGQQHNRPNRLKATYGYDVERVQRVLQERSHLFPDGVPVGPVGYFISVAGRDQLRQHDGLGGTEAERMAVMCLIEKIFRNSLTTFIVPSLSKDQENSLKQILMDCGLPREAFGRPQRAGQLPAFQIQRVSRFRGGVYDVSRDDGGIAGQLLSVWRCLDKGKMPPVVLNHMADKGAVTTIITRDRDTQNQILHDNSIGKITQVYELASFSFGRRNYGGTGGFGVMYPRMAGSERRLALEYINEDIDKTAQIQAAQAEDARCAQEHGQARADVQRIANQEQQIRQARQQSESNIRQLNSQREKALAQEVKLNEKLDHVQIDAQREVDTSSIDANLEQLDTSIKNLQEHVTKAQGELSTIQQDKGRHEQAFTAKQTEAKTWAEQHLRPAHNRKAELETEHTQLSEAQQKVSKRTEDAKRDQETIQHNITVKRERLNAEAEEMGDPPEDVTMTAEAYKKEARKLKLYIEKMEKQQGKTPEQAEREAAEAERRLKDIEARVNGIEAVEKKAKENYLRRSEKVLEAEQAQRAKMKKTFQQCCANTINWQGNLGFRRHKPRQRGEQDHDADSDQEEGGRSNNRRRQQARRDNSRDRERDESAVLSETYSIDVEVVNTQDVGSQSVQRDKQLVTKDLKSLSGGEKSTVQCALLMAFAQLEDFPVHLFDEPDVYMDEVNRIRNMDLLFELAMANPQKQWFFFTPHYEIKQHVIGKYGGNPRVKVVELAPPQA